MNDKVHHHHTGAAHHFKAAAEAHEDAATYAKDGHHDLARHLTALAHLHVQHAMDHHHKAHEHHHRDMGLASAPVKASRHRNED